MFSKFRPLNGLILNTVRRTYFVCSKVYSYYPNTSNKGRPADLLKTAGAYRQERFASKIYVVMTKDKFYIDLRGKRAELLFDIHESVMTISKTQVPKELGGHGLGKILARTALAYALLNGYFIRVQCNFVMHYIEKYEPQYAQYMLR